MILTQEEAKLWGEILIGFSQGKEYEVPYSYDDDGNVTRYIPLTDFTVNKNYPTICLHPIPRATYLLDPRLVKEKE